MGHPGVLSGEESRGLADGNGERTGSSSWSRVAKGLQYPIAGSIQVGSSGGDPGRGWDESAVSRPGGLHRARRREGLLEVFGQGEPTILLLPTWSIIHARHWKMQVPYLARHYRVVTFDGRGNGRSDRPTSPEGYADEEFVDDAVAVMDATETSRAFVVGFSNGGRWALQLAAWHPERVLGLAVIGPMVELGEGIPWSSLSEVFDARFEVQDWWAKYNRHHWLADYPDFVQF